MNARNILIGFALTTVVLVSESADAGILGGGVAGQGALGGGLNGIGNIGAMGSGSLNGSLNPDLSRVNRTATRATNTVTGKAHDTLDNVKSKASDARDTATSAAATTKDSATTIIDNGTAQGTATVQAAQATTVSHGEMLANGAAEVSGAGAQSALVQGDESVSALKSANVSTPAPAKSDADPSTAVHSEKEPSLNGMLGGSADATGSIARQQKLTSMQSNTAGSSSESAATKSAPSKTSAHKVPANASVHASGSADVSAKR